MGGQRSHTGGGWGDFPRADYKIDARAPQRDPASVKSMSATTGTNANFGTDAGAWDFMFKNRLTGNNPLSASARATPTIQTSSGTAYGDDTPTGASAYTQPASFAAPAPTGASLPTLAAGKPSHAGPDGLWWSSGSNQVIAPKPFVRKPVSSTWEAPTTQAANQIAAKYASPKAIAMNDWLMKKPVQNG